jgi:hypothetical protein
MTLFTIVIIGFVVIILPSVTSIPALIKLLQRSTVIHEATRANGKRHEIGSSKNPLPRIYQSVN